MTGPAGAASSGELDGKVAVVTGAASGIGRAVAVELARHGAAVALVDRDRARLASVPEDLGLAGKRSATYAADLADVSAIPGLVDRIVDRHGRVDILVNSAGHGMADDRIRSADPATWDAMFAIHVKAPVALIDACSTPMIEVGGGRIVNISSSSAFRARNAPAAYASCKAALVALTRIAAAELGEFDINVNAVVPGATDTGMLANLSRDELEALVRTGPLANLLGRISEPADVASAVAFLCLRGSRQITGQAIHTSAGTFV